MSKNDEVAIQSIRALLSDPRYKHRTFDLIKRRLKGVDDDKVRDLLIAAGATSKQSSKGEELWSLEGGMTENLSKEFKGEVRKQAIGQAAKWMIMSVIFLLIIAGSGWWLYFKPKIDEYIQEAADGIPSGAVVAFLSAESDPCPGKKWNIFNEAKGRFIVGAGQGAQSGLTDKKVRATGGEERVKLSIEHMPEHRHAVYPHAGVKSDHDKNWDGAPTEGVDAGGGNMVSEATTGIAGGDSAHNNMPPYLALYYCIKE
ncbi:hypothetical protein GFK91_31495 (plasmid) [Roseibium aggregatum]|uniref:phage tail protein n=1 Tax=Roseibium aggregatum TaxID=187304 RepID=UPI001E2B9DDC|nr:hypothetical protein [Roseibium aggregatum]UES60239.1 hypothetical protein GFK91_31495 [Roseibium aggregatum]